MTIATQICKRIYQGDGETRVWELDFPVLSASDVQILVTSSEGTEEIVSTGYEINLTQGTVTYPTVASGLNALATGQYITLLRATPPTQTINLTQQGVLDAEELENGYDKLTLQVQELAEKTDRCIKYSASSGKTGADADDFLADLEAAQTAALSGALDSVAQTKTDLEQTVAAEETARQSADLTLSQQLQTVSGLVSQQGSDITAEETARVAADQALSGRIDQLCFIQLVTALPETGNSKYLYAILQEDTDDQGTPLAVLYVWDSTANSWSTVGAFSTNLDPDTLLSKTEAASTYIPLSQKAATNGVASLDGNTQVPLAQLPIDSVLSSTSENPIQNKVVAEALEEIEYETWQKPTDWMDIRSGALPNSIYFLVGHSADYTTYPQFGVHPTISNSGTYDVYVDGVKQVSAATNNTDSVLAWQTLALTSGWDVTHPTSLRTHIVRVTPTVSTNKITQFRLAVNSSVNQGVLWMHSTVDGFINFTNLFHNGNNLSSPILEAVTTSMGELKGSFSGSFWGCEKLVETPIFNGDNNSNNTLWAAFQSCKSIKKIKLKNLISGTIHAAFLSCANLQKFEYENVALELGAGSYDGCEKLQNILPISKYASGQNNNFIKCSNLFPFVLDLSFVSSLDYFRIGATSSSRLDSLKGVTFNTGITFTNASNTINVSYTGLDRAALVNMFNSLPTVTGTIICDITGAIGAADLDATDLAIATNKGWTVTR